MLLRILLSFSLSKYLDCKNKEKYNNTVIDNGVINDDRTKYMAVKDHSLDEKIIKAAKEEFMQYGFQKASLHKIAQNAGLTTGALYTRYKNKDALFCSLMANVMEAFRTNAEPLRERYYAVEKSRNIEELIRVMEDERSIYLDILFEYYDECKLFFCHSVGSSIETNMEKMMQVKADETIAFLKRISKTQVDLNGVEMILKGQFQFYHQILQKGYSKEEAVRCMETVELFFEAGWKKLFEEII